MTISYIYDVFFWLVLLVPFRIQVEDYGIIPSIDGWMDGCPAGECETKWVIIVVAALC